jgi:hypothetical protein
MDRALAVRSVVEDLWDMAEQDSITADVTGIRERLASFVPWRGETHVMLDSGALADIVRTLAALQVSSEEVLTAVRASSSESDRNEPRSCRSKYLQRWEEAVETDS